MNIYKNHVLAGFALIFSQYANAESPSPYCNAICDPGSGVVTCVVMLDDDWEVGVIRAWQHSGALKIGNRMTFRGSSPDRNLCSSISLGKVAFESSTGVPLLGPVSGVITGFGGNYTIGSKVVIDIRVDGNARGRVLPF